MLQEIGWQCIWMMSFSRRSFNIGIGRVENVEF